MLNEREAEGIRILALNRGGANALDTSFLGTIAKRLDEMTQDSPRGLVLTGEGSMFSAGLDLIALSEATRDEVEALLAALFAALRAVFVFPRPVVAAINGHAIAGGALLALACDRRLMTAGKARIGLTETQLGLPMPSACLEMLRYSLGRRALERMVYSGATFDADEAVAMGAVDEVTEPAALIERAVEAAIEWSPSVSAFADIKSRLRGPTVEAMQAARENEQRFVDAWFDPQAQERISQAVAQLRARRS